MNVILLPEQEEKLQLRKRPKVAPGVKGTRLSQEVQYRRNLEAMVRQMEQAVRAELVPLLRQEEHQFKRDAIGADLIGAISGLRERFSGVSQIAASLAANFTEGVSDVQRARFTRMAARAIGVDQGQILEAPGIAERLELAAANNAQLIRSIPEQYLSKIESTVFQNVAEGRSAGSIAEEIQKIGGVTKRRAQFIAKDQTQKLVSNLNQARQQALGVVGYRWRNSQDQRVRGNPAGLYPNAKFSHWTREGQYFLWEPSNKPPIAPNGKKYRQPPADGAPGQAINCRCTSEPVFQFN